MPNEEMGVMKYAEDPATGAMAGTIIDDREKVGEREAWLRKNAR